MNRPSRTLRLVPTEKKNPGTSAGHPRPTDENNVAAARNLSDKAMLLRPLKDEHLLEVYREAKKMNLSAEFIELLEDAIEMRQLEPRLKA